MRILKRLWQIIVFQMDAQLHFYSSDDDFQQHAVFVKRLN